jgi:hypothetical protein
MRVRTAALLTTLVLATAACSEVFGGSGSGWLRATVSELEPQVGEAAPEHYELDGDGWYSIGRDPATNQRTRFSLGSSGMLEEERRSVSFMIGVPAIPSPGRYAIELPLASGDAPVDAFAAVFLRTRLPVPGTHEVREGWQHMGYVATEGWIEITRSSSIMVEGTFHFVAAQHLLDTAERDEAGHLQSRLIRESPLHSPDLDAPKVEVSGSFRVRPATSLPVLVD